MGTPAAADDIPTFETLSCEKDCPPRTDAKALNTPIPTYPSRYTGMTTTFVEALVDVDYTIATDGTVKEPKVEYLLGPHQFADNALEALASRRYEPATEDGKPVEENRRVRFMFRMRDAQKVGREEVARAYANAMRLARSDKVPEAIAVLKEAAQRPEMNFYERTMVAFALATMQANTGDTGHATLCGSRPSTKAACSTSVRAGKPCACVSCWKPGAATWRNPLPGSRSSSASNLSRTTTRRRNLWPSSMR